ncbi:MAG: anion transporter, partial [Ornithinimicrobium sp.]
MSQDSGQSTDERAPFEGSDDNEPRATSTTWMFRGLGLAVALAVYFLLAGSDLSADGRVVAAIGSLKAVWWMTEAIPLSATSL